MLLKFMILINYVIEFHTSLVNVNLSSEFFLMKVYHILCKFNLDDMSLALNLFYDPYLPSIQSRSITNEEPIANPITQMVKNNLLRKKRKFLPIMLNKPWR
jgi:hypothetical protein